MSSLKFSASSAGEGSVTLMSPAVNEDIEFSFPTSSGKLLLTSEFPPFENTEGRALVSDGVGFAWGTRIKQPGEFLFWGGKNDPEGNFLLCDGSTLSRSEYPDLFNAIGTAFGEGDGRTTFAIPNFIGRTIWGGNVTGQYLSAGLPNIVSQESSHFYYNTETSGVSPKSGVLEETQYSETFGAVPSGQAKTRTVKLNLSKGNSIYGNSETVQPPALVIKVYIAY